MKNIYFRKVKGGGLKIYQFIFFKWYISLNKNSSWSNGDVHGWRIQINKRNNTCL